MIGNLCVRTTYVHTCQFYWTPKSLWNSFFGPVIICITSRGGRSPKNQPSRDKYSHFWEKFVFDCPCLLYKHSILIIQYSIWSLSPIDCFITVHSILIFESWKSWNQILQYLHCKFFIPNFGRYWYRKKTVHIPKLFHCS